MTPGDTNIFPSSSLRMGACLTLLKAEEKERRCPAMCHNLDPVPGYGQTFMDAGNATSSTTRQIIQDCCIQCEMIRLAMPFIAACRCTLQIALADLE